MTPVPARGRLWAALIKAVYEVDPLKCPTCGGTMKIVSFIEKDDIIRRILKHCNLWKEPVERPPPKALAAQDIAFGQTYDTEFFNCLVG